MSSKKTSDRLGGERKPAIRVGGERKPAIFNKANKAAGGEKPAQRPHSARETATIDGRTGKDRRAGLERRKNRQPVAVERRGLERRAKVNRRRQIDPTTCERDYTAEEIEFMAALDAYKRSSGRMFPTCSEVLEVFRGLGYEKRPAAVAPLPVAEALDATQPAAVIEAAV